MADQFPLVLKFGGSLVEQLGAQLYPSVTATVAELISNAWDADARNVWITIPFDGWTSDNEIVVLDDGHGMTREQARDRYLIVGRRRRMVSGVTSEGGRRVHGRKGIGKLAAFGTAGLLECETLRDGVLTSFGIDYEELRQLDPTEDYEVEPVADPSPPMRPDGTQLTSGTRVRLSNLRVRRAVSQSQFLRSMSRRFVLDRADMRVFINGTDELDFFDIECEFRFPDSAGFSTEHQPPGSPAVFESPAGSQRYWAQDTIDGDKQVLWWIGFTEKPLPEAHQQGISIIANGKMAQRPFKFERGSGTEGQLGQEYLVGEMIADWIDSGVDIDDDLIQSNRDQLQLEDERLTPLLEFGRQRLTWALRRRTELKRDKAVARYEDNPKIKKLLEPYTKTERKKLLGVARAVSQLPEVDDDGVVDTMESVINAQSDRAVREMIDQIEEEDDVTQERMWNLVREFGLVDARKNLSIVEARLATIRKLKSGIKSGAREVPDLHVIILNDPWLLDPRWNLLDDELKTDELGIVYDPECDESGERLDFLFALAPRSPAPLDQVIVVEIKRGTTSKGQLHKANDKEVQKFHTYVVAAQAHYAASTNPPHVRGLMIAQGYTEKADAVRRSLETLSQPPLAFRTWDLVIEETERMHLGWLAVSTDRVNEGSESSRADG